MPSPFPFICHRQEIEVAPGHRLWVGREWGAACRPVPIPHPCFPPQIKWPTQGRATDSQWELNDGLLWLWGAQMMPGRTAVGTELLRHSSYRKDFCRSESSPSHLYCLQPASRRQGHQMQQACQGHLRAPGAHMAALLCPLLSGDGRSQLLFWAKPSGSTP